MRYLLDSNVIIGLLRGHARLTARFQGKLPADFGLSAIAAQKLYFGACKSTRRHENLARLDALRFEIVPFARDDSLQAGEVREALRTAGAPIGPYDTLIAGQACARDLILITHNLRKFSRVEGLRVEDWE